MPSAYYTVDDKTGVTEIVRVVGLTEEQTEELYDAVCGMVINPRCCNYVGLTEVDVKLLPASGSCYFCSSCNPETIQY